MIKFFWDMCWLRAKPQDTPYSIALLVLVAVTNAAVNIMQLLFQQSLSQALSNSVVMLVLTIFFTAIVLRIKNFSARFVQTTTALLSTEAIINLLILPFILCQFYILHPADDSVLAVLLSILFLMVIVFLNIWVLIVTTNIFRHALELPFVGAALVTAAFVGLHILIYLKWIT